jgi:hypothetical protein
MQWRRLGLGAALLLFALVLGGRAALTDARLRAVLTRQVPGLAIQSIALSLWTGVEAHGLAFQGTSIDHAWLRWSPWRLFAGELHLAEAGARGVVLAPAPEPETEGARASAAAVTEDARQRDPSPTPPAKVVPWTLPALSFPIDVVLARLSLQDVRVRAGGIGVEGISLEGAFRGRGDVAAFDLDLAVGDIALAAARVSNDLHLRVHMRGFQDIQADWEQRASAMEQAASAHIRVVADLVAERVSVPVLSLQVASAVSVAGVLRARDVLHEDPVIEVDALRVDAHLAELAPILTHFSVPVDLAGTVLATLAATARLSELRALRPRATLQVNATDLHATTLHGNLRALGMAVTAQAGEAGLALDGELAVAAMHASAGEARDVRMTLHARAATVTAPLQSDVQVDIGAATAGPHALTGCALRWTGDVTDLRQVAGELSIRLAGARSGEHHLHDMRMSAKIASDAARASVTGLLSVASVFAAGRSLGPLRVRLGADKQDTAISLRELSIQSPLAVLHAQGALDLATQALRKLHFQLELPNLAALAPQVQSGRATLQGEVSGTAPHFDAGDDPVQSLAALLARGLPLRGAVSLQAEDVSTEGVAAARAEAHLTFSGQEVGMATTLAAARLVDADDVSGGLTLTLDARRLRMDAHANAGRVARAGLPVFTPIGVEAQLDYVLGGDLQIEQVRVEAPEHLSIHVAGVVEEPWRRLRTGLPPALRLTARMRLAHATATSLGEGLPTLHGALGCSAEVATDGDPIDVALELAAERATLEGADFRITEATGRLPLSARISRLPFTGALKAGDLYIDLGDQEVREAPPEIVYARRLHPYRQRTPLTISELRRGDLVLQHLSLEGAVDHGLLRAQPVSFSFLGGDFIGGLRLQLTGRGEVGLAADMKVSNLDASTFPALGLHPGPESELSADFQVQGLLAKDVRDLDLRANVTKIGAESFDRVLQLLDPTGTDAKIQKTRKNLSYITLHEIGLWIRYEAVNVDLDFAKLFAVPFTEVGFPNLSRELLRNYSISNYLDKYVPPWQARLAALFP